MVRGLLNMPCCLFVFAVQDKVVNSISELYSFMDSADATLALKVLGEVDENGEPVGQHGDEGTQAGGCSIECPAAWALYHNTTFVCS